MGEMDMVDMDMVYMDMVNMDMVDMDMMNMDVVVSNVSEIRLSVFRTVARCLVLFCFPVDGVYSTSFAWHGSALEIV